MLATVFVVLCGSKYCKKSQEKPLVTGSAETEMEMFDQQVVIFRKRYKIGMLQCAVEMLHDSALYKSTIDIDIDSGTLIGIRE